MTLLDMSAGTTATVVQLRGGRAVVNRLAVLGFTPGAAVTMVQNYGHGPLIVAVRDSRVALGRGERLADVLAARQGVTEGVATAPALVARAASVGVELPVCAAVADLVAERITVDKSGTSPVDGLMLGILAAFAEFERRRIKERQAEGIALAKARGSAVEASRVRER